MRNRAVALAFDWHLYGILGAALLSLLPTACSQGEPELQNAQSNPGGGMQGQLIEVVARYDDGSTRVSYRLRVGGNERDERELVLQETPDVLPMSEVRVYGRSVGRQIHVDRLEFVAPPEGVRTSTQALIGAPPLPPTKLAMMLVDTGSGVNTTAEDLNKRLFTNPDSVKAYYLENSFGMHDLVGQVLPTAMPYPMSGCDTSALAASLRAQVDKEMGGPSDVYLWYIGQRTADCAWSGLSSGKDTFYNASASCVVLVQEPGHSFGLSHSSRLDCKDASGAPTTLLDDPNTCVHQEYGNSHDTMGGGCNHFSAYQKVYRTYLQKCNGVRVKSSGKFTLFPVEKPCNGVQVLQVPMPKVRPLNSSGGGGADRTTNLQYYLVELRAPLGFDKSLKPSVLINAAADFRVFGSGRNRGEHIWLLDMAPGTATGRDGTEYALAPGQTFTDPAGGVSITTESVSAESATIRVDIEGGSGDPTCLDNTPLTPPGPSSCGDGTGGAGGTGTGGAATGGVGTGGASKGGSGGSVTGGRAGSGGRTGSGGSAGKGGSGPGTGGVSGGASGAGGGGTAGNAGRLSTGGRPTTDDPNTGTGCNCHAVGVRRAGAPAGGLLLTCMGGIGLFASRRRHRKTR